MVNAFKKQLILLESNPSGKKFLLAVSGGLDSVVMAELFRLFGYKFSIAHCNFQLRGKESDADEKFVKKLAAKAKVPFYSVKFETKEFCRKNKLSVQMGARQLRYEWLEEIREKNKFDYVVTAHHGDDAIETFFINLLRGTGLSGLHGIKAKNGNIVRPLLGFYRNELEAYAKENILKWREDSSNSADKYERNKIRHHLIPMLTEINPKAKESVKNTIENLGRTEAVLNSSISSITGNYIQRKEGRVYIHFDLLKKLSEPAGFLYEVIKEFGFNYGQCRQIVESVEGQPGKTFLSASHRLVIDRENLIIEPTTPKNNSLILEVDRDIKELLTATNTYLFSKQKNKKDFKIPFEADYATLDYDKLTFPLKIRKWENGDKFYPLGMKKPKKVSNFLVDNKISVPDKERVYVLLSGNKIAWLIGHRPDERFKVTQATKNLYLCKSQKAITL